ncbi:SDR family oxidoreductase [Marinomonas transparens]|uniref:SDR family oxidoreductase n=1 Tax=Marinomonas transparens TaxID=2795388 RepID=A0A934JIJ8_9GAMM|nr:SDR family oxidoreductase [Marinomonas transparens]MBJ7536446.1 SDR family oxidoreductase [Marinomonas transparens]
MSDILIAGCGDLGSGLAIELIKKGHKVTGVRRTGCRFPDGVQGITGDLVTMKDEVLPDADLVVLIMTPQGRTEESYRTAYFDTAQVIIRRYQSMAKPPRVLFVSSTSVYGQNQGEWVDESTIAEPSSATAKVLVETEQALAAALPSVSVRCSGIYGPGRYRLLDKIVSGEDWGPNSWTNRVHRDDVVSALMALAQCALEENTMPDQVIVTDQTPVSMWEVKLWLATALGVSPTVNNITDFFPKTGKRLEAKYLFLKGWKPNYSSYTTGYQTLIKAYLAT